MTRAKPIVRVVCAVLMMGVGLLHFVNPDPFVRIVPAFLPAPLTLVYVSGFFEILGGAGLLVPRVRFWAAWGLIALYVAVFPANINMAVNQIQNSAAHYVKLKAAISRAATESGAASATLLFQRHKM